MREEVEILTQVCAFVNQTRNDRNLFVAEFAMLLLCPSCVAAIWTFKNRIITLIVYVFQMQFCKAVVF